MTDDNIVRRISYGAASWTKKQAYRLTEKGLALLRGLEVVDT